MDGSARRLARHLPRAYKNDDGDAGSVNADADEGDSPSPENGRTLAEILAAEESGPGDDDAELDAEPEEDPEIVAQRARDLEELSRYNVSSEIIARMEEEDIARWAMAARDGRQDVYRQHLMNHVKKITKMLLQFCGNKYILITFIANRAKMLDDATEVGHPATQRFFSLFPTQNKEFVAIMLTWEDYIRWMYELADSGQLEMDKSQRRQLTAPTMANLDSALTLEPDQTNEWSVLLNLSAMQGHHERTELFGERLRVSRVAETLMFKRVENLRLYGRGITDPTLFEYHQGSDAIFRRLARSFEFDATGGWKGGRLDIVHYG